MSSPPSDAVRSSQPQVKKKKLGRTSVHNEFTKGRGTGTMGNGKKISPTIFKKISGNHREKDLGGSIYGLARTSFFF